MVKKEKKKKGKHLGGRPTKFKQQYIEDVKKLIALGAIDIQIADYFGVSEVTLNAWKQKYPLFLKSLKKAKVDKDAKVEKSLFERASGYDYDDWYVSQYQGKIVKEKITRHQHSDSTSMIFWLKNRQPQRWRDKQETHIVTDQPITINIVTNGKVEQVKKEEEK